MGNKIPEIAPVKRKRCNLETNSTAQIIENKRRTARYFEDLQEFCR